MDKSIIHKVFEGVALRCPDKIAVEDSGRHLTYAALNRQAGQVAEALLQSGSGAGRVVMTLLNGDATLVTALLGILKAGAIYMPADRSFPEMQLQQLFEEGQPDVLITSAALQEEARALLGRFQNPVTTLLVLDEQNGIHIFQRPATLPSAAGLSEGCYIFYTSGSTGKAKAILGSQRGLGHFIHWELTELGLDENCRVSQLSQFTFDASLRDIFVPLCAGGTLCMPPAGLKMNIPLLLEWLADNRITLIHCVPSILRLLTRYQPKLPDLEYMLLAGEPLYVRDILDWRRWMGEKATLVNLYGTSETTMAKTFYRIGQLPNDPAKVLPAGKPISNTAIAIFNGNKLCAPGEIGEIYIKTPFRSHGYLRNEALTNSVFVQNPLVTDRADILHRTGDMGRYAADGTIEVHGRLDDQVKINGIRVELGHVRQAVLTAPDVSDAVVIVHRNAQDENELACYYVCSHEADGFLRQHLVRHLSEALIPTYFIRLDQLPLTINGKVDKKALPRPVLPVTTAETAEDETDPVVLTLIRIWKEVLGLPSANRNTLFFPSGGTSLKAIMAISLLYKEYHVQIKIKDIFEHPSLGALSDYVRQLQQKAFESIDLVPQSDSYATTFAQKGIWLHLQYGRGLAAYNMTGAYHFTGELDLTAFTDTVAFLVERYEVLRTTFVMDKGELRQRVLPFDREQINIRFDDHSHDEVAPDAVAIAESESVRLFEATQETLIRWRLVRLRRDHYCLMVTQHHLIADGWSIEILMKEFLQVLGAFSRKEKPLLPALKIQYKDYAAWFNRYMGSVNSQAASAFWRAQLEGPLEPLPLVTGSARGRGRSFEGRLFTFELPAETAAGIFRLADDNGCSVFSVLLTLVNVLLYGYTGREEILIGSPFAGRIHPDLEDQLGLFVNILVLRNTVRGGQPFRQLLEAVSAKAGAAYEHGAYPLEQTLDEAGITGDGAGLRFLNVFLQMQEAHGVSLQRYKEAVQGLQAAPMDFRHLTSKFELTFNCYADRPGGAIGFALEYDRSLFSEEWLNRVQTHLVKLTEQVVFDANQPVSALTAMLQPEKNEEIAGIGEKINSGISRDY
jgi:amino acid adenylation domain-containing protein